MARISDPNDVPEIELGRFLNDGRLTCPHCGQSAKPHKIYGADARSMNPLDALRGARDENHPHYKLSVVICAGCSKETLFVRKWDYKYVTGSGDPNVVTEWQRCVHPIGRATKPFPSAPDRHLKSYQEACTILELSPAASACMSRRCLQGILKEQGYAQKDLVRQIEAVLGETDNSKSLSATVRDSVDAIRQYGNFGAHPITDVTTLQILEVEPGEAEWCIELVEDLLDHYYEQPAKLKARRAAANAKLSAGGKPELKSG